MAQFKSEYQNFSPKPSDNVLVEDESDLNGNDSTQIDRNYHGQNLISEKERVMLKILMRIHVSQSKRFQIKKKAYEKMNLIDIQSHLSRDYHFLKWSLVEILEV